MRPTAPAKRLHTAHSHSPRRQRLLRLETLESRLALAAEVADFATLLNSATHAVGPQPLSQLLSSSGKITAQPEITRSLVPGELVAAFSNVTDLESIRVALSNSLALARVDLGGSVSVKYLLTLDGVDEPNPLTLVRLRLGELQDVISATQIVQSVSGVAWAAPNYSYQGAIQDFTPSDPSYGSQYHHTLMQNNLAWDTTLGSPSVIVAVTDNGLQLDHPDIAPNVYVNTAEIPGNGIDDDGNGYVDDRNGWDFVTNDNDPSPINAADNHGTHVAGIVGARTNNAIGVAGTAGGVKIMPLRFAGTDGGFTSTIILNTYKYAADNGAKIVTTSYNIDGFVGDPIFTSAMQYLYDHNVLHFNSAGNGLQANPARQAFYQTLLVANTNESDARSGLSNYGIGIDVSAPGNAILSTLTGSSYGTMSGTSMATPNAAGVAALIWSANPSYTRDQVAARLVGTTDNIDSQNPQYIGMLGSGRVNSNKALNAPLLPPKISQLREVPAGSNPQIGSINRLTVALSNVFAKSTVDNAANWSLVRDGNDNLFGTADDVPVPLTAVSPYMIGANDVTFSFPSLVSGSYRFTAVSGGLRDPFLTALDGDANGTAGGNFVRDFRVSAGTIVFSADFSDASGAASAEGFTTSGPFNQWHLSTGRGTDAGHSVDDSFYFGAFETASGGGSYANLADGSLTSPPINLSGIPGPIKLEFNHNSKSEEGYDFASVLVIDGVNTTQLAKSGSGIPHDTVGFEPVSLDLSAYAGHTIQIRFQFTSDDSFREEGWYVDDVTIRATTAVTGLSGRVWNDADSDGVIDAGEASLAGWTTYLDTNDNGVLDAGESSTTTDSSGNYAFNLQAAGTYIVRSVVQSGFQRTVPATGRLVVNVAAGQSATGLNFGNTQLPTEIRGVVWNDVNGNHTRDAGDNGQANWTVYLDSNSNGTLDSFTSSQAATDVPAAILDAGTITSQTVVAGLNGTLTDVNVTLSLSHTNDEDLDLYLVAPNGTMVELATDVGGSGDNFTGTVFDQQAGTAITAGVAPFTGSYRPESSLDAFNGGTPSGTWTLLVTDDTAGNSGTLLSWSLQLSYAETSATTTSTGDYAFTNLVAGSYVVREVSQAGWTQTFPLTTSHAVTLALGDIASGRDFGNTPANTNPQIADIPNQSIAEDQSAAANFTISDLETPAASLTLTASTSDPVLLPLAGIVFGGSGSNRTITLTPTANLFGTVTVTVTVNDGAGGSAQDTLVLTVNSVNDPPTFTQGADQVLPLYSQPQTIANWAMAISPGPTNEAGQSVTFQVTGNNNPALFQVPPALTANGTLTFTPAYGVSGTAAITIVAQDDGGIANGGTNVSVAKTLNVTVTTAAVPLQITSFLPLTNGWQADFNRNLDVANLNLYVTATSGATDASLIGATAGTIKGSLVIDPSLRRITFVSTSGPLPADTYTLTLRSAADGFRETASLTALDGDANGTPGGDYVQPFVVAQPAPSAVTLSIPNLARGPQQPVNMPANGTSGIPISFSNGGGITSASFQLRYRPDLLNVTGATVAPGMPTGSAVNVDMSVPGIATIQFTSPTPLPAGTTRFIDLQANVPSAAPFLQKHVLDLTSVVLNGGSIPAIDDDGLHVAAYFGDVTANGSYSGLDASTVLRLAVGLDAGLDKYRLLDPMIMADLTGGGGISATDGSIALRAAVGLFGSEVPSLPNLTEQPVSPGPDPKLSLPQNLIAGAGDELLVPVRIDSVVDLTGNGFAAADLVIRYDAAVLDISRVTLGNLFDGRTDRWTTISHIDPAAGQVLITVAGTEPLEGLFRGDLVLLHITVKDAVVAGRTSLNLAATASASANSTRLNEGGLTLIPAPTNAADDEIDGLLIIVEGLQSAVRNRGQDRVYGPQPLAVHDQALLQLLDGK